MKVIALFLPYVLGPCCFCGLETNATLPALPPIGSVSGNCRQ